MGEAEISVINERKMLYYYKDICMVIETCYAEYQNQVKRRASTSCYWYFFCLGKGHIDSMSSTEK